MSEDPMSTSDRVEDIVNALFDSASDGEVGEVLVVYRDPAGEIFSGLAADDRESLIDAARQVLARLEAMENRKGLH